MHRKRHVGFISSDFFAPHARIVFIPLTSYSCLRCMKGVRSCSVPSDFYMGFAAASYCDIGGSPSRSSIERSIELVV